MKQTYLSSLKMHKLMCLEGHKLTWFESEKKYMASNRFSEVYKPSLFKVDKPI